MCENNIQYQLDLIRPSPCCSDLPEACYCPAYVGSLYGTKTKILFVGLDAGTSLEEGFPKTYKTKDWAKSIGECYREPRNTTWDPLYRGCVRAAGAILGMNCQDTCVDACRIKPSSECVLSYFSQTNAVKCVPPKKGKDFYSQDRIVECMGKNLFAEIEVLQPDVIVLQGKNRRTGHIHEDFVHELKIANWGSLSIAEENLLGTIEWARGKLCGRKTVLALFTHPSARGKLNFSNTWSSEVLPVVPKIHALLSAIKS